MGAKNDNIAWVTSGGKSSLNEEIFKGNIINWKETYPRGCELLKFKKDFSTAEASQKINAPTNGAVPDRYVTTKEQSANATIFYEDQAKSKLLARLRCYIELGGWYAKVVGFSQKYALMMTGAYNKFQLWDLTVNCKHTNTNKWKSEPNKKEICTKKCSFVRDIYPGSPLLSTYFWEEFSTVLLLTFAGLQFIDMNSAEESRVEIDLRKYRSTKYNGRQGDKILDVRVMPVNGVSMAFCHVQSRDVDLFVNVTTKRVHLVVDARCKRSWISKSLKVAVMNAKGDQMRVVSIAEEQPKILAKYNFDVPLDRWNSDPSGVLSSPEGHVIFLWRYIGGSSAVLLRAYLWEIGYMLDEISIITQDIDLKYKYAAVDKNYLVLQGHALVGQIYFNHAMNF